MHAAGGGVVANPDNQCASLNYVPRVSFVFHDYYSVSIVPALGLGMPIDAFSKENVMYNFPISIELNHGQGARKNSSKIGFKPRARTKQGGYFVGAGLGRNYIKKNSYISDAVGLYLTGGLRYKFDMGLNIGIRAFYLLNNGGTKDDVFGLSFEYNITPWKKSGTMWK